MNKLAIFLLLLALLPACRQDMHDQGKYEPLEATRLFDDGRSARPLVEGTVARGFARENTEYYTGKTGNFAAATFPFEVTEKIMLRGQERYNIFCAPCHDKVGTGKGMIVQRGYRAPPSLHIERLQLALPGHFFDVMTNGFGAMPSYARQISVEDRWAIIAYIRALQYSQNATVNSIPAEERAKLEQQ